MSATAGAPQLRPHHFKPGQSGNPSGRPRKGETALEVAKRFAPPAMLKLAEMAGLVPGVDAAMFESTRLAACKELLDRALGRPAQTLLGDSDKPVVVRFQWQNAMESPGNSADQQITGDSLNNSLVITTEWSEVETPSDDTPPDHD